MNSVVYILSFFSRLAVLKINGEELLQTRDDGAFLDILKSFFQSIESSNDHRSTIEKKPRTKLTVNISPFYIY